MRAFPRPPRTTVGCTGPVPAQTWCTGAVLRSRKSVAGAVGSREAVAGTAGVAGFQLNERGSRVSLRPILHGTRSDLSSHRVQPGKPPGHLADLESHRVPGRYPGQFLRITRKFFALNSWEISSTERSFSALTKLRERQRPRSFFHCLEQESIVLVDAERELEPNLGANSQIVKSGHARSRSRPTLGSRGMSRRVNLFGVCLIR